MGLTCINIHVHTGHGDAAVVRAAIIEALRQQVLAGSFVEVADPAEPADRTIAVAPIGSEPWIAVFDEAVEVGADEPVLEVTQLLSTVVPGAALAVCVHDSDAAELFLYRDGRPVDAYSSDPTRPEWRRTRRQIRQMAGQPERWRDLLLGDATPATLREIWASRPLFAEEIIERTGDVLGLSREWRLAGLDDALHPRHEGVTLLSFRSTAAPAMTRLTEGLPQLAEWASSPEYEASVGDRLELTVSALSVGGPGHGLAIVLTGDALDRRLFVPTTAQVSRMHFDPGRSNELHEAPFELDSGGQRPAYVAHLDDVSIPAGLIGPWEEIYRSWRWYYQHHETQLSIVVRGRAATTGVGELSMRVVPLANPEAGQVTWTSRLIVLGIPRRPLRASPKADSATLRPLEPSSLLVGFVALGADRATCAAVVGQLFERWCELIQRGDEPRQELILQSVPLTRPTVSHLRARRLSASRRWRELRSALATCEHLAVIVQLLRSGITFDATSAYFRPAAPGDQLVPCLGFYDDLTGLTSEEDEAAAIATAMELIDDAMRRAGGLQALLTRWSWRFGHVIGRTPYEAACDIGAEYINGRAWCTRFLRGVAERLWIGPELLDRLGDPGSLERVAAVTSVGAGVRVELAPSRNLDDLEGAIARLLPSRSDWEAVWHRDRPRQD